MAPALRNAIIVMVLLAVAAGSWWYARDDGTGQGDEGGPQRVPVVLVMEVERQRFADELEALGTTRAAESVEITARVSNVITAIRFEEGQLIERDATLVELENSEALANHAAAQAALVESRSQYQRSRELLRTGAVSASRVEELEATMLAHEAALRAAEARLQDHRVRAPFTGYTGLRRVSPGTLVTPGTVITTLDDTSTILLDFTVPETYLSGVSAGQVLNAGSAAYPERRFEGIIATVDSRIDPVTRAVTVRARLPNDDGLLMPGMYMTVRVLREAPELLMVPEQAIVPQQDRRYLFIVDDDVATRRQVQTGRRTPGLVEIVSGLEEGEVIVVEGTQRLRDVMPVNTRHWTEPGT